MTLHISLIGRKDLSVEIYRQIRDAIVKGVLRPSDRIPATRELAATLNVSRMTVTVASPASLSGPMGVSSSNCTPPFDTSTITLTRQ